MGGVDIILGVDWKQLKPTANNRAMDKTTTRSKLACKEGYDVYNSANQYWYLTKNNRINQSNFLEILEKIGNGDTLSPHLIEMLQQRSFVNNPILTFTPKPQNGNYSFAPIVVSTNALKLSYDNSSAAALSASTRKPLFTIFASMKKNVLQNPTNTTVWHSIPKKRYKCLLAFS